MYGRIIKNDLGKNKFITITISVFIFIAAMLTSLAIMLSVNLYGAIDNLLIDAKPPHFMQMHVGNVNMERLNKFVNNSDNIEDFQVLEFLNIDGAEINIGENSLDWSLQDNGFSSQSKKFDFLLNLDNEIIYPKNGEVYVPIYYMKENIAQIGDVISIRDVNFTVAGFIRDSQMNAELVTSKRFLISDNDFEKITEFGFIEYLIEFRLRDTSYLSSFESTYIEEGLETDGPPALTYTMIRLANAITDGMMIAVLILISILVIVINFLCIRFTLLAKIEEEYKEIGVLKGIGIRISNIKKIYIIKYVVIAGVACISGYLISLIIQGPFMENITLYMGESNRYFQSLLFGLIGVVIIFLIIILYVNRVLCCFNKISAAEAIRFGAPKEKSKKSKNFLLSNNSLFSRNVFLGIKDIYSRKKLYITMFMIIVMSTFVVVVPQNIYNTISSRDFVTNMGIGSSDILISFAQIQTTDDVAKSVTEITSILENDNTIQKYAVLTNKMFDMKMDDGIIQKLRVTIGNHEAFPISYSKGEAPKTETEIAISNLYANDLEKAVGDEIILLTNDGNKHLTISGIYSDITNGGRTSKALFETDREHILAVAIPITFYDRYLIQENILEYREKLPYTKVSSIDEHISQLFGGTMNAIQKASYVSILVAIMLSSLITLLFMKMLIIKDRYSIAILKSLGFNNSDIRKQYITRSIFIMILGVAAGIILANSVGEFVGVALISSFGASSFNFVINPIFVYVLSPLLIATSVTIITLFGVSSINLIKISEHIKEV